MAVDPGCSQKEVIASLLTYHVCKRVSELYPAMKHKVEFYFRADPQANPATARICRGFNGRILPPIWSFQKALTFQSEAYAGELLTID
ncbi:MAG: hypothetical protein LR015_13080 [Verrucomicrobia bacterium]|nr:hypothetical protein [Verrucomicrobiota bacterium]